MGTGPKPSLRSFLVVLLARAPAVRLTAYSREQDLPLFLLHVNGTERAAQSMRVIRPSLSKELGMEIDLVDQNKQESTHKPANPSG